MSLFLIAGLGNPGPRYAVTRHNAGFLALDALANKLSLPPGDWREKYKGLYTETRLGEHQLLLVKPQTFMNASGEALGPWMAFYKIKPSQCLVLLDDYSLPFGRLRLRDSGSHGGHNGLKSVETYMGSAYARVRLGIFAPHEPIPMADFVLQPFSPDEKKNLGPFTLAAAEAALDLVALGTQAAMNRWNGFRLPGKP
jgi:PTH1 family peptidyl-tRNA hydrolase